MSEERRKKVRLLIYWAFSTTLIVFGAITAYIAFWVFPIGGTAMDILKAGFPIWGSVGLAAIVLVGVYYFYYSRQETEVDETETKT